MIKKVLVLRTLDGKSVVGTVRITIDNEVAVEWSPRTDGAKCLLIYAGRAYDEHNYIDITDYSSVVAMVVSDKILYVSTTTMNVPTLEGIYSDYRQATLGTQTEDNTSPTLSTDSDTDDIDTLSPTEQPIENVHVEVDNENSLKFYYKIRDALEEMYVCYPEEKTLSTLIEDSKWVRIDSGGSYYVVGKVYMDNTLRYICYGLPGDRSMSPPDELANHTQYIPVPNREGGYFVVFQDANTGELLTNCD